MISFPSRASLQEAVPSFSPVEQRCFLVGGELRPWDGPVERVLSVVCHTDGDGDEPLPRVPLGSYPLLTKKEALEALDAAAEAYDGGRGAWPTMPVRGRIECLERFTFAMQKKREEVVLLLMMEIGKSAVDARKEFDRTVEYIADTIAAMKDLDRASSRFTIEKGIIGQIRRAPLGVVLCMGPYNYPLNETFTTLIPALLMGNTVVFKPPKFGVLLHSPLLEAFATSFPPGVVNVVYGDGREVVGPMMASGRVDVLAFIGSSRVANILKQQHPRPSRLRCVLGLEAKNAGIVLAHADVAHAARECVTGSLSYNGQRCTALKVLFVAREIVDAFLKEFLAALAGLRAGMPWEEGVALTPLPDPGSVAFLRALVADAEARGAAVLNPAGGAVAGSYMHPAVLYPVTPAMRLFHEEQFGPVVPVVPFDDIREPIDAVMRSHFGQQVSLFGTDARELARLIDPLVNQVCRVNINSQCQRGPDSFPFTGRKDSAEGTLSVSDALRVFSIRTLVAAKSGPANEALITEMVREHHSAFLSTDFIF